MLSNYYNLCDSAISGENLSNIKIALSQRIDAITIKYRSEYLLLSESYEDDLKHCQSSLLFSIGILLFFCVPQCVSKVMKRVPSMIACCDSVE